MCQAKLRAKVKKLEKENMTLKSELDGIRKVNSKMRVQKHRWGKSKESARQSSTRRAKKKLATEKKKKSYSFSNQR